MTITRYDIVDEHGDAQPPVAIRPFPDGDLVLYKDHTNERDELLDMLCDCAGQFLMDQPGGTLCHSFMSTEERLCDVLVKYGKLAQVSRGRFRWTEAK